MYEVTVTAWFSGAHRLREYKGKCENLHGHNWKVSVTVSRPGGLDRTGMVIDFGVLKEKLKEILHQLDHAFLNDLPYFKKKNNPTSENIARFISEELAPFLKKEGVKLSNVSIWETETSMAVFRPGR